MLLAEESKKITAVITHDSLYHYRRRPYGNSAAPDAVQIIVFSISCTKTFHLIGDVIIYGKDQAEHDSRLENILHVLCKANLTCNALLIECQYSKQEMSTLASEFLHLAS